jgi:hypothetical protein
MNTFQLLAEKLLEYKKFTFYESNSGKFGFERKLGYTGSMANPKGKRLKSLKNKGGLFDFVIFTGNRFNNKAGHRELFEKLVKYSSIDNCLRVWRGEDPTKISKKIKETEALVTLALMMFEQEINWGNEEWQSYSNFAPYIKTPKKQRPRDMIMGYVYQSFELGVENIKYWQKIRPNTTTFLSGKQNNRGYRDYPICYKKYFTDLGKKNYNGTEALMVGEIREKFKEEAINSPDNPKSSKSKTHKPTKKIVVKKIIKKRR